MPEKRKQQAVWIAWRRLLLSLFCVCAIPFSPKRNLQVRVVVEVRNVHTPAIVAAGVEQGKQSTSVFNSSSEGDEAIEPVWTISI